MIAKTETNDLDVLETLENESTEQPENDANSDGDDADDDFVAPEDRCVYFPASALETEIDVDSNADETEEPRR